MNPSSPSLPSGAPRTPDERATTFQPVEGGGETRSGTVLLVEAYAVLWAVLMGWLILLYRKQNKLGTRIDELERVLDKAAAAPERRG